METIHAIKPGHKPEKDDGKPDRRRRVNPETAFLQGLSCLSSLEPPYRLATAKWFRCRRWFIAGNEDRLCCPLYP
ncbi:hypothetical protein C7T94_10915 [Pedobacter yulinensis]|uniref:Uncharacterized protein n=1 Tax=Pedobacter yulinensis TaxID=2126353 RepID=A0A2T3HKZ0_9SPHI|nr:hypothetical protein C7T94_10915 [Pedobacter yulinensis]